MFFQGVATNENLSDFTLVCPNALTRFQACDMRSLLTSKVAWLAS